MNNLQLLSLGVDALVLMAVGVMARSYWGIAKDIGALSERLKRVEHVLDSITEVHTK